MTDPDGGTAESTQASAIPSQSGAKGSTWFPIGFKDGIAQWWTNIPAAQAEHNVLSFIPYISKAPTQTVTGTIPPTQVAAIEPLPTQMEPNDAISKVTSNNDPYGTRMWSSSLVRLRGHDRALNEFAVERSGEPIEQNLVMLHGYGAGLGLFYKNFEGLSRVSGWKIYALDLLGMGRSSRPPFKLKSKNREQCITEAEDWFIDALEEWRVQRKIDRFTLLAHSLGGYLGVAYALKYPGHLNKLVLASPVGIPEDPNSIIESTPTSDAVTENTKPRDSDNTSEFDRNNLFNARNGNGANNQPRKPLPKWLTYLWDANISPFSIVRAAGPLGPQIVSGWTTRRFSHLSSEEYKALHIYAYTLFKQRGSGEYALAYILAPGAFARSPLIRRIGGIGRQVIKPEEGDLESARCGAASSGKELGIPVVLMYGENDWMDVSGGHNAVTKLNEAKELALSTASKEDFLNDRGSAKVLVVKAAGHHLYLDNWEEFNEYMRAEMRETSTESKMN